MNAERWLKENIEAVAIAVVMALVIRQFAIEAFKIPTGSMTPTLLGDIPPDQSGDRILVDKIGPLFSEPDRFDITRTPYDLSAFGVGRHFCIGAQLARLELEVALGHVIERLRNMEVVGGFDAIPYRANPAVRGPASLPIRFDPGPRVGRADPGAAAFDSDRRNGSIDTERA